MDRGACWATVHGAAKSRTQLSNFTFTFPFHALEKEMATHSSVLAWRIPGMGEPGGLPSMGSHRVGHDWRDLAAAAAAAAAHTTQKFLWLHILGQYQPAWFSVGFCQPSMSLLWATGPHLDIVTEWFSARNLYCPTALTTVMLGNKWHLWASKIGVRFLNPAPDLLNHGTQKLII